MIKYFKKLRTERKKGATMVLVLLVVITLMILGSSVALLASSAYKNSYAQKCKDQAFLTAKTSLDVLDNRLKSNADLERKLHKQLELAVEDNRFFEHSKANQFTLRLPILYFLERDNAKSTNPVYQKDGEKYLAAKEFLGDSYVDIFFSDEEQTQMMFKIVGIYKGYSDVIQYGYTRKNNAITEIEKALSNSLLLKTPIVNMIGERITGDIYIDTPVEYKIDNTTGTIESPIFDAKGNVKRDKNGNIMYEKIDIAKRINEEKFNRISSQLKGKENVYGHTKKKDFFNNDVTNPNFWTEVYIRRVFPDNILFSRPYQYLKDLIEIPKVGTMPAITREFYKTLVGNITINSDALIGLYDPVADEHGFGINGVPFDLRWAGIKFEQHRDNSYLGMEGNIYVNGNARVENLVQKGDFYCSGSAVFDTVPTSVWPTLKMNPHDFNWISGDVYIDGNAYIKRTHIGGNLYVSGHILEMEDCTVAGNVIVTNAKRDPVPNVTLVPKSIAEAGQRIGLVHTGEIKHVGTGAFGGTGLNDGLYYLIKNDEYLPYRKYSKDSCVTNIKNFVLIGGSIKVNTNLIINRLGSNIFGDIIANPIKQFDKDNKNSIIESLPNSFMYINVKSSETDLYKATSGVTGMYSLTPNGAFQEISSLATVYGNISTTADNVIIQNVQVLKRQESKISNGVSIGEVSVGGEFNQNNDLSRSYSSLYLNCFYKVGQGDVVTNARKVVIESRDSATGLIGTKYYQESFIQGDIIAKNLVPESSGVGLYLKENSEVKGSIYAAKKEGISSMPGANIVKIVKSNVSENINVIGDLTIVREKNKRYYLDGNIRTTDGLSIEKVDSSDNGVLYVGEYIFSGKASSDLKLENIRVATLRKTDVKYSIESNGGLILNNVISEYGSIVAQDTIKMNDSQAYNGSVLSMNGSVIINNNASKSILIKYVDEQFNVIHVDNAILTHDDNSGDYTYPTQPDFKPYKKGHRFIGWSKVSYLPSSTRVEIPGTFTDVDGREIKYYREEEQFYFGNSDASIITQNTIFYPLFEKQKADLNSEYVLDEFNIDYEKISFFDANGKFNIDNVKNSIIEQLPKTLSVPLTTGFSDIVEILEWKLADDLDIKITGSFNANGRNRYFIEYGNKKISPYVNITYNFKPTKMRLNGEIVYDFETSNHIKNDGGTKYLEHNNLSLIKTTKIVLPATIVNNGKKNLIRYYVDANDYDGVAHTTSANYKIGLTTTYDAGTVPLNFWKPVNPGYVFKGWYSKPKDSSGNYDNSALLNLAGISQSDYVFWVSDLDLYARFEKITDETLKYTKQIEDKSGGGSGDKVVGLNNQYISYPSKTIEKEESSNQYKEVSNDFFLGELHLKKSDFNTERKFLELLPRRFTYILNNGYVVQKNIQFPQNNEEITWDLSKIYPFHSLGIDYKYPDSDYYFEGPSRIFAYDSITNQHNNGSPGSDITWSFNVHFETDDAEIQKYCTAVVYDVADDGTADLNKPIAINSFKISDTPNYSVGLGMLVSEKVLFKSGKKFTGTFLLANDPTVEFNGDMSTKGGEILKLIPKYENYSFKETTIKNDVLSLYAGENNSLVNNMKLPQLLTLKMDNGEYLNVSDINDSMNDATHGNLYYENTEYDQTAKGVYRFKLMDGANQYEIANTKDTNEVNYDVILLDKPKQRIAINFMGLIKESKYTAESDFELDTLSKLGEIQYATSNVMINQPSLKFSRYGKKRVLSWYYYADFKQASSTMSDTDKVKHTFDFSKSIEENYVFSFGAAMPDNIKSIYLYPEFEDAKIEKIIATQKDISMNSYFGKGSDQEQKFKRQFINTPLIQMFMVEMDNGEIVYVSYKEDPSKSLYNQIWKQIDGDDVYNAANYNTDKSPKHYLFYITDFSKLKVENLAYSPLHYNVSNADFINKIKSAVETNGPVKVVLLYNDATYSFITLDKIYAKNNLVINWEYEGSSPKEPDKQVMSKGGYVSATSINAGGDIYANKLFLRENVDTPLANNKDNARLWIANSNIKQNIEYHGDFVAASHSKPEKRGKLYIYKSKLFGGILSSSEVILVDNIMSFNMVDQIAINRRLISHQKLKESIPTISSYRSSVYAPFIYVENDYANDEKVDFYAISESTFNCDPGKTNPGFMLMGSGSIGNVRSNNQIEFRPRIGENSINVYGDIVTNKPLYINHNLDNTYSSGINSYINIYGNIYSDDDVNINTNISSDVSKVDTKLYVNKDIYSNKNININKNINSPKLNSTVRVQGNLSSKEECYINTNNNIKTEYQSDIRVNDSLRTNSNLYINKDLYSANGVIKSNLLVLHDIVSNKGIMINESIQSKSEFSSYINVVGDILAEQQIDINNYINSSQKMAANLNANLIKSKKSITINNNINKLNSGDTKSEFKSTVKINESLASDENIIINANFNSINQSNCDVSINNNIEAKGDVKINVEQTTIGNIECEFEVRNINSDDNIILSSQLKSTKANIKEKYVIYGDIKSKGSLYINYKDIDAVKSDFESSIDIKGNIISEETIEINTQLKKFKKIQNQISVLGKIAAKSYILINSEGEVSNLKDSKNRLSVNKSIVSGNVIKINRYNKIPSYIGVSENILAVSDIKINDENDSSDIVNELVVFNIESYDGDIIISKQGRWKQFNATVHGTIKAKKNITIYSTVDIKDDIVLNNEDSSSSSSLQLLGDMEQDAKINVKRIFTNVKSIVQNVRINEFSSSYEGPNSVEFIGRNQIGNINVKETAIVSNLDGVKASIRNKAGSMPLAGPSGAFKANKLILSGQTAILDIPVYVNELEGLENGGAFFQGLVVKKRINDLGSKFRNTFYVNKFVYFEGDDGSTQKQDIEFDTKNAGDHIKFIGDTVFYVNGSLKTKTGATHPSSEFIPDAKFRYDSHYKLSDEDKSNIELSVNKDPIVDFYVLNDVDIYNPKIDVKINFYAKGNANITLEKSGTRNDVKKLHTLYADGNIHLINNTNLLSGSGWIELELNKALTKSTFSCYEENNNELIIVKSDGFSRRGHVVANKIDTENANKRIEFNEIDYHYWDSSSNLSNIKDHNSIKFDHSGESNPPLIANVIKNNITTSSSIPYFKTIDTNTSISGGYFVDQSIDTIREKLHDHVGYTYNQSESHAAIVDPRVLIDSVPSVTTNILVNKFNAIDIVNQGHSITYSLIDEAKLINDINTLFHVINGSGVDNIEVLNNNLKTFVNDKAITNTDWKSTKQYSGKLINDDSYIQRSGRTSMGSMRYKINDKGYSQFQTGLNEYLHKNLTNIREWKPPAENKFKYKLTSLWDDLDDETVEVNRPSKIISDNTIFENRIVIPSGHQLIIKTTNNIVSVWFKGGLTVGKGSCVTIMGGGTAFFYFGNGTKTSSSTLPVYNDDAELYIRAGADVGNVMRDPVQSTAYEKGTLYMVSSEYISVHVEEGIENTSDNKPTEIKIFGYMINAFFFLTGNNNITIRGSICVGTYMLTGPLFDFKSVFKHAWNSVVNWFKNLFGMSHVVDDDMYASIYTHNDVKYKWTKAPSINTSKGYIQFGQSKDEIDMYDGSSWVFNGFD